MPASISHVAVPSSHATTPTPTYATTSRTRRPVVAGADAVVDGVADDVPAGDRRGSRDGGEREHDPEAALAPLRVAPEAA